MISPMNLFSLLPLLPLLAIATPSPDAAPAPAPAADVESRYNPFRIPVVHTENQARQNHPDLQVRQEWLKNAASGLRKKYEAHLDERGQEMVKRDRMIRREEERRVKRATGSVQMTDVGIDASYAGQVSIGNPAQNFLLILDTGSSDCWVADTDCTDSACSGLTKFRPSSSSTYQSAKRPFDISYGSGDASGLIASDTITMGGFTVQNQGFAVVNSTSSNLINAPMSGLMGLAWSSIAQTRATPFWQALAASGSWTSQEMGVFMARWRGVAGVQQVESNGGSLYLGGTDTSLYTGNINYISIPTSNTDYWRIPLEGVTVGGSTVSVSLSNGQQPSTAIDTGTTLIAAPPSAIRAIYSAIPGAAAMSSSQYQGLYQFPCRSVPNVTLQYGGLKYSIAAADMSLGSFTRDTSMCTGAFFEMDISSQSPIQWIVGASFLKNVYSVYRYNPPAIGFAQLSGSVNSVSNGTSPATTGGGTISGGGSSGTGSSSGSTSGAGRKAGTALGLSLGMIGAVAGLMVAL